MFSFESAAIEMGDLSNCVLTKGGRMPFHGVQFTDGFTMRGSRSWMRAAGWTVSEKTVAKSMARQGLVARALADAGYSLESEGRYDN